MWRKFCTALGRAQWLPTSQRTSVMKQYMEAVHTEVHMKCKLWCINDEWNTDYRRWLKRCLLMRGPQKKLDNCLTWPSRILPSIGSFIVRFTLNIFCVVNLIWTGDQRSISIGCFTRNPVSMLCVKIWNLSEIYFF